ncbi:hypothetical protein LQ948_15650 [Jiella sp. MQZ9-1]|uniref:Uncharacterized protein n=2 Tax=Jiella flava TaxID=2816857 RepID=A0A939JX01_9HYPH|nr:hypothetical protein [Jiella flava]MBO0664069.1 hypothetical protein [Jiella flava]MCD2472641.1 hypothetical protein [Jiella flava]
MGLATAMTRALAMVLATGMCCGVGSFDGGEARAGAWTLEAGTGQIIATGLQSVASESFGEGGGSPRLNAFTKTAVDTHIEYGVKDWLTGVVDVKVGKEGDGLTGYARSGVSHVAAGARLRLFEAGGLVGSAQILGRFVTPDAAGRAKGLAWSAPQFEPRLSAGYGFTLAGIPGFVDAEAALRFGTHRGIGRDAVKLDITAGLRPWRRWQILAQTFSTVGVSLGGSSAHYAEHKVQAALVYDINRHWSIETAGFATVAGTNALKERGVISALWFRY